MIPRLAWVLGDPTGIGPELVAKSLANVGLLNVCRPVLVGPAWVLEQGMQVAGKNTEVVRTDPGRLDSVPAGLIPLVDVGWPYQEFTYGKVSGAAGKLCIEMLRTAYDMAKADQVAGVVFAPLNKEALHKGGNPHRDELHLFADWLGDTYVSEINAAAGLFTTRVTSHVPLKDVAGLLNTDKIVKAVQLLHRTLTEAGEPPTVAVAALNPHGGEHGLCGDEEQTIIAPAVAKAHALGIPVVGPYPADTIFRRAQKGEFHGIVTMYHDQGQIATKLLGFDQGVTIQGGLSVVTTTPAHGTAFDIAGRGKANTGAFEQAVNIAARMAAAKMQ